LAEEKYNTHPLRQQNKLNTKDLARNQQLIEVKGERLTLSYMGEVSCHAQSKVGVAHYNVANSTTGKDGIRNG